MKLWVATEGEGDGRWTRCRVVWADTAEIAGAFARQSMNVDDGPLSVEEVPKSLTPPDGTSGPVVDRRPHVEREVGISFDETAYCDSCGYGDPTDGEIAAYSICPDHGQCGECGCDVDDCEWRRDTVPTTVLTVPTISAGLSAVLLDTLVWAKQTFPDSTAQTCAQHLRREVDELLVDPTDPLELADCAILVFDAAQRAGVDMVTALKAKLEVNRARRWGPPDHQGVRQHLPE